MTFHRYVALGDSFTEGVGDPDPARPNGLRGWADRVAEVLAEASGPDGDFGYANLAIRGRKLSAILEEQVEPALALRPDLVTIYAGANDILRPRVDLDALVADYDAALARLAGSGAQLLVWTAFDPGGSAIYRPVRGRFAIYNELVRECGPPRCPCRRLLAAAGVPRLASLGRRPDAHGTGRSPADGDRGAGHPRRRARPRAPRPGRRRAGRTAPSAARGPGLGAQLRRPVGAPPAHRPLVRGLGQPAPPHARRPRHRDRHDARVSGRSMIG
jgi:hypothetical protein